MDLAPSPDGPTGGEVTGRNKSPVLLEDLVQNRRIRFTLFRGRGRRENSARKTRDESLSDAKHTGMRSERPTASRR